MKLIYNDNGDFMGLFNIFSRKKETIIPEDVVLFRDELNKLCGINEYISKKEYAFLRENFLELYKQYTSIIDNNLLKEYCNKNNYSIDSINEFIDLYNKIDSIIIEHNKQFLERALIDNKTYLDNILKEVDPVILLDNDQRSAVLNNEDYCMIIAGAGAGKTTTIAAKVRYLVEKKHINPLDILIVSFTNKAVKELRERINDNLKINCPITTFHATGNAILRKQSDEKLKIVSEELLYVIIRDFILSKMKDDVFAEKLILFFGSYFEPPFEGSDKNSYYNHLFQTDFTTLKSNLNEYSVSYKHVKYKKIITINNEIVNSGQEVQIANFLYLNGIDYEYEPQYPYHIKGSFKRYTPDFLIKQGDKVVYLEHFGISESGENSRYSEQELAKYKKCINDKVLLHREHNTRLIYTFSKYDDGRELLDHLKELLIKEGFELNKRDPKEVLEKLSKIEENKYVSKLVALVRSFISNFKVNGYTDKDFDRFIITTKSPRTKIFLEICKECYLAYQQKLATDNSVDFADMINNAAEVLRNYEEMHEKLTFKYIIVDEYQDISRQRFDLVKELSKVCDAKICVVGDDWQSIYAFSGADVSLFTKFKEKMGYASEIKITRTYRNSQEVIDIAGDFIQRNDKQIRKALTSPKHISDPIIVYSYDDSYKSYNKFKNVNKGAYYNLAEKIELIVGDIISENPLSKILIIGRYNFDGLQIERTGLFTYDNVKGILVSKKYPKANLTFMTAHSSKGLGYDQVIIINAKDAIFGFPSKIEDDSVMNLVIHRSDEMQYAEERRLFYVALTRTKNRVYIVAPQRRPSQFVVELLNNYKTIKLIGELDPSEHLATDKLCPICGYPLQRRHKKDVGLDLWVCTNDQEVCGFLTNDLKAGKLCIQKCDKCKDGYLIIKKANNHYFLGCTNWKPDKTGCNNTVDVNTYQIYDQVIDLKPANDKKNKVEIRKEFLEHMSRINESNLNANILKGFDVIVDEKGEVVTNIELLQKLRTIRNDKAKELDLRPFRITTNKILVRIATYLPITKEEFCKINGCSINLYNLVGQLFIEEINKTNLR